ncbi:MAG: PKD domain-containing protein [Lewinellaceae bacterium]|nr:PKD domain-containing protein [Phaeodactylibacter sp.]MCB9035468.1 PKD domain-containing protein [Lewinellaceae bacterium]
MKKIILFALSALSANAAMAQPDCTDSSCGTVTPEWGLVGEGETSVCEGTPFELTGASSMPLSNIDDFHWFIMNSSFSLLFDTLLTDASEVPYLVEVSDSVACQAVSGVVKLWVALQVTSPPCNNGQSESCWVKIAPLTVNLLPRAAFSVLDAAFSNEVCVNTEFALTDSSCHATDYFWDFGDGTTFDGPNPVHQYNQTGTYTASLTVSNSCGSDTYTRTIEVVDDPAAGFTSSLATDDYCFPATVQLNDASNQWSHISWEILPEDSTLWCLTDTLMSLGDDTIEVEFKQPGDYKVTLTAANACGIDMLMDTISIYTDPFISLFSPGSFCDSAILSSADLSFVDTGDIHTYTWIFDNASQNTATSPVFTNIAFYESGNIILIAEGFCDTLTQTVPVGVVTSAPISFDSIPASICQNQGPVMLDVTPGGGDWSGLAPAILSTDGLLNPGMLAPSTYTLTYTVGDEDCRKEESIDIEILPPPQVNLGAEPPACDSLLFTPNVTYQGTIDTYAWTFPGADPPNSDMANPGSILFSSPDTIDVIIETGGTCGTVADTVTLEIQQNVNLAIEPVDSLYCLDAEPDTLQADPGGGIWQGTGIANGILGIFDPGRPDVAPGQTYLITYTYTSGACTAQMTVDIEMANSVAVTVDTAILCIDGQPQLLVGNPDGGFWSGQGVDSNGIFHPDSVGMAGDYPVLYEYEDSNDCPSEATGLVIVENPPQASLSDTTQLCIADFDVSLEAAFNYSVSPEGGTTTWSGPGVDGTVFNAVSGTDTLDAGFHIIQLEYRRNDCVIRNSAVIELIPTPEIDLLADTIVCISDEFLQLQSNLAGIWSGGPGIVDAVAGLINLDTARGGTHQYTFTFAPSTSCENSGNVTVQVIDLRDQVDAGPDVGICDSLSAITLTDQSPIDGFWDNPTVINGVINLTPLERDVPYAYSYCIESELALGCRACDTLSFIIHSNPSADFETDDLPCVGREFSFLNNSTGALNYYWDFGNPTDPNDTSTLEDPTYDEYTDRDTFTITLVSESEFGCRDTFSRNLYVTTPPAVDFTLASDEGCAPFEVLATNNSYGDSITQMWCIAGDTILGAAFDSIFLDSITTDSIFDIVLKVENFCGPDSLTRQILVHPYPIVNFGINVDEGCSPLEIEFSNTTVGQPDSFFWDLGFPDSIFMDALPPNQTYTTSDDEISTYTITLIAKNDCGADTVSREITVYPPDIKAFIGQDTLKGCPPLTVELENHATVGAVSSWIFIDPNGEQSGSEETNPTVIFEVPGWHTILLSATRCGTHWDTAYVEVLEPPIASFTHPPAVCQGAPITFANTSENDSGSGWDFGDGSPPSDLNSPTHVFDTSGTFTVTLTAYSEVNNCPATFESTVLVYEKPQAGFDASALNGCAPLTIDVNNLSDGNDPFDYTWEVMPNTSNPSGSNVENPTFTFTESGNYFVHLTVEDINGCLSDTAILNIFVYEDPVSRFFVDNESYCLGYDSIFSTNTSQGAISYKWFFQGGPFSTYEPVFIPTEDGVQEISLIAENSHGCLDTFSRLVEILPSPEAAFSLGSAVGCQPLSVSFSNTSTGADTYHWFFGNGDTSMFMNSSTEYMDSGAFEALLVAVNSNGCPSDSAWAEVIVRPKPTAAFSHFKPKQCGAPAEVFFENLSDGNYLYNWDFGDGSGPSSQADPTHTYREAGLYPAILIAENEHNCRDTAIQEVDIFGQPQAALQLSHVVGCEPLAVTVSNASAQASQYFFNGNPAFEDSSSLELNFEESGTFDIELIAVYNEFCTDTLNIAEAITIYDTPSARFFYEADNNENIIGDVQFINNSIDGDRFLWDFGDGTQSDEYEPFHEYNINRAISVLLTAYNDNGGAFTCVDDTLQSIEPEWISTFFAPNAFSPEYGEEGVQVFKPVGIGIAEYEISVYSPYGQLVWHSTALEGFQPAGQWDGTFQEGGQKDELLPQGSYTWMAVMTFLNGERRKVTGSVTLLR